MDLDEIFILKGKKIRTCLQSDKLEWSYEATPDRRHSYQIPEIISCWICPKGSLACCMGSKVLENSNFICKSAKCRHYKNDSMTGSIVIEVCERRPRLRWVPKIYVFQHASADVLMQWHSAIRKALNGICERPRNLTVFINPVSGKANAKKIYKLKVQPLFERAGIYTKEILTEEKGHASRYLQEASSKGELNDCDGIVTVGGDGLVSEVALGLILSAAKEIGTDPHTSEADLPRTKLRLGVIPGGSTDAICHATHGASDPTTACLHIIMGDNRDVDVGAVHTHGELEKVFLSQISYGWFGDLLSTSEQLRSLGPSRYIISGARHMFKNKKYPVNIKVKDQNANSSLKDCVVTSQSCSSLCSTCATLDDSSGIESEPKSEWIEINGKYNIVSAAVTSCACRFSPGGVSPRAHLGDGYSELILVSASRGKLLSYIYKTMFTDSKKQSKITSVTRTNEIHLQGTAKSTYSCDGEILRTDSIKIRIHRQKLRLFCRGVENPFPVSEKKPRTGQQLL